MQTHWSDSINSTADHAGVKNIGKGYCTLGGPENLKSKEVGGFRRKIIKWGRGSLKQK